MTKVDGLSLLRLSVRGQRGDDSGSDPSRCRAYLDALERDNSADHAALISALLDELAVWFPVDLYRALPVILPHVARDNSCRKAICKVHHKRFKGRIGELRDVWSMPDRYGYVRDDNSLIKALVSSLQVDAPGVLSRAKLGTNFVACHVWRMKDATDPWLNSFIPNLVWLPKPLDIYSDRDGHLVQSILRCRSLAMYSGETCAPAITRQLWAALPACPRRRLSEAPPNTFVIPRTWSAKRTRKIHDFSALLDARCAGKPSDHRSGHSHYDLHLTDLEARHIRPLTRRLADYRAAL